MLITLHIDNVILLAEELMRHESFEEAVVDHYFGEDHTSLSASVTNVLSKAAHDRMKDVELSQLGIGSLFIVLASKNLVLLKGTRCNSHHGLWHSHQLAE